MNFLTAVGTNREEVKVISLQRYFAHSGDVSSCIDRKKKRNEFRNSRKSSTNTIKINFLVDADVLHSGSTHANRLGFAEKEKIIKRNNMIKQNVETKRQHQYQ